MDGRNLSVTSELIDSRVKFECSAPGRESIFVDYIPPVGNGEGFTSLELLLASISTCMGTTAKVLIEGRLKKKVEKIRIRATGERRQEHPTYLEKIRIDMEIISPDLDTESAGRMIEYGKQSICPVINMIGSNVSIDIRYTVLTPEEICHELH